MTTAVALAGMTCPGAALGPRVQAYTLVGQASAPIATSASQIATLTFTRQLGGSIGAAAMGWLLLAIADQRSALTAVFAVAALALTLGLLLAPRRVHESLHDHE